MHLNAHSWVSAPPFLPHGEWPHPTPIFSEPLCLLEGMALRLSPIYYGANVPHGDGSAVVVIPGLLLMDFVLFELYAWLRRIGYRPYYSGIGIAADCPNQLSRDLDATIDRAYADTNRRVHVVGYSLGGVFARSAAVRRPNRISSVITLGTPYRGLVVHRLLVGLSETVRDAIRSANAAALRQCGTSHCQCSFGRSLGRRWPETVRQTAVYSKSDGLVDWRYCLSGKPEVDIEVVGTHLGLPFNAGVFAHIARRLADHTTTSTPMAS